MAERPLSPHLFAYKFKYTLATSILNRFTGLALSVGLLVMAYWLMALAGGPAAYAHAGVVLSSGFFKLLYVGFVFAFSYHLAAGIRHLIWDTGSYMERAQSQRSAWFVALASVVLTAIFVYFAFLAGAHAI
jgi:succinate dehydrogenase / fumarate reductase cytochrome b subunit